MNAELAARRTAAAAVLSDFRGAEAAFNRGLGGPPSYPGWALRLSQHLRYVLDALNTQDKAGTVTLTARQASVVRDALAEAEAACRDRAAEWCGDCAADPFGACQRHLDDLDQADEYRKTAAELGVAEAEPSKGGRFAPQAACSKCGAPIRRTASGQWFATDMFDGLDTDRCEHEPGPEADR